MLLSAKLNLFINSAYLFLGLTIGTWPTQLISQNNSPSYQHDFLHLIEKESSSIEHSALKPYRSKTFYSISDSLNNRFKTDSNNLLNKDIFNKHLVKLEEEKSTLWISPIMDLSITSDLNSTDVFWYNQRGLQLQLNIDDRIRVESKVIESYFQLPEHLHAFAMNNSIVPELGRFKHYGQKKIFDITNAMGWIEYQALPYFKIELGHDKHFWGEGYRSMFLSDAPFYYPYLKLTTDFGKVRYINLYASHQDINFKIPGAGVFGRKYAASHILSWEINKNWNLGFFESIVWGDSLDMRKFDLNYINPVIFYRPIEYSLGSDGGNAMLGSFLTYRFKKKNKIYAQFLLDDLKFNEWKKFNGWWKNKYAFQLGLKCFDILNSGLSYRLEINWALPYTYSHFSGIMNYGHFNQSLAHPYGANFRESVLILRYNHERFEAKIHFAKTIIGLDPDGENWGQNIYNMNSNYEQSYGNHIGQGLNSYFNYLKGELSYILNPSYNLRFIVGYELNQLHNENINNTRQHVYVGLRTNAINKYMDFF